jgi:hypothetical protein
MDIIYIPETPCVIPAESGDVIVLLTGLTIGGVGVDLNLFLGLGAAGFATFLRFVYFLFTVNSK